MSPATKIPGTEVSKLLPRSTLPRSVNSTPKSVSRPGCSGPTNPIANSTRSASISKSVPSVLTNSPSARVAPRTGLVGTLAQAGDFEFAPKQAWTNVADFAARGLDALNLGPGMTSAAHASDERVEIEALGQTYDALRRFLAG